MNFGITGRLTAQHTHARSVRPHAIIIHDTVSHNAKGAQSTLDRHGYATHFFVETNGDILQCMDPATQWGAHCGGFNENSIGIDVVAILDPSLANAGELLRTVPRSWSASKRKGKVIDYTDAQKLALMQLVEALCAEFGIPHTIPAQLTTYGKKVVGLTSAYRGVLAHGQWSSKRWDGLLGAELLIKKWRSAP